MYSTTQNAGGMNQLIDLRSDTVTRPSAAMREAMVQADVGDDVYGDDPTVNRLEEEVAELLGKEAGLFAASGTQSNLLALLAHCERGDEYIGGVDYHIPKYEAGGAAVLGGISPRHLALNEKGGLNAADVEAAIQPDDFHFARSKLVCLENTYNGMVMDQSEIEAVAQVCQKHDLALHLDGARLMNAAVRSQVTARSLVTCADTVSLCLSKGLGAPVGSVLCGPKDFINKARRARKMLGGGLRQSGVLAACGLYALQNNVERLAEDHDNAHQMAERLAALDGITLDLKKIHTNMIWMSFDKLGKTSFREHMKKKGLIVADPFGPNNIVRLITHLDFDASYQDVVVDAVADWLKAS